MAQSSLGPTVSWEIVSSGGPALAHHTGAFIQGCLYVHGGIVVKGSTTPAERLFKFETGSASWVEITAHGSPALSHHASVVVEDRYFVVIGGWNGKARTSDVHVFDVEDEKWFALKTSGFPVGAGLSSFTATLLAGSEILIVGREGSLRMQRRSGNAFLAKIDLGHKVCTYKDYPMGVASRSGHTTSMIGSRVVVLGGRNDKLIEQHSGYSQGDHHQAAILNSLNMKAGKMKPMTKLPCGRKHHIAVAGPSEILVHGGETFDGRSRYPVSEVYLLTLKPQLSVVKLGTSDIGRAGHIGLSDGDSIYIHGGVGEKNMIYGELYQLKVS